MIRTTKSWEQPDMNAAKRSYQAAMSNGRGRQHEMMIEGACRHYKQIGRAKVEKMPEPFRVMKKDQRGIATVRFTAHAEPDFIGCVAGGRSLAFEAKHTDHEKLHQKVVTPTQAESLQAYEEMGAIAAVCAGIGDECFMIPWTIFANMKKLYGRLYVTAEDVVMYKVKFNGLILFLDYEDTRMGSIAGK